MPQLKKEHVRDAILAAARRRFAESGVKGSPLAEIAAEAGTSIGNLYKYFADKDALFAAAVPPEVGPRIRQLLRQQIEALGTARDIDGLAPDHPYREAATATLAFSIAHRDELLFLLRHGPGTTNATFAEDVAGDLTRLSIDYASAAYPDLRLTAADRRALRRTYAGWVAAIADILAHELSPQALAAATRKLATYHLAGLRALFVMLAQPTEQEPSP